MKAARYITTALAVLVIFAGCERETRVVRWDPMLGNLPNAESGTPFTRDTSKFIDPTKIAGDKLVLEDERGKKTLLAKTGRHLMTHIYNCIANEERDLFTEQVLSEMTKK